MRWSILLISLLPVISSAAGMDIKRLCASAEIEGALAAEVEQLVGDGQYPFQSAEQLLTADCDGSLLLSRMIETTQAENFEYAIIDMGANVNDPVIQQEGGKLSIMQYLLQQVVIASSEQSREFAMDYMYELRDVDFNPNLLRSLSMN